MQIALGQKPLLHRLYVRWSNFFFAAPEAADPTSRRRPSGGAFAGVIRYSIPNCSERRASSGPRVRTPKSIRLGIC